MRKIKSIIKNENGQSMVEFALVLPILLLLLSGIIEFGWVFGAQLAANNCAREGARYAVTNCYYASFETNTKNRVSLVAPNSIKENLNTIVLCSNAITPRNGDITVKVTSKVKTLTVLGGILWDNGVADVSASVTMKAE